MKHFFYHHPGMIYAVSVRADNERDARAQMRKSLKVNRLPRGAAVWEANP